MPDQSSAASEHALIQEITAPLETLPDDPLALVEADFPTAMRGYDRHAVDDYVMRMSRLVAELQATRSPEAAVRRALERVGEQISGILRRAHETAEQITAQSRVEAEDRLEEARREATSILDAAEHRVRELDADTDRVWGERQQIVAEVEDLSRRLRDVVRDAGERYPAEEARGSDDAAESPSAGGAGAELVDADAFTDPEAFEEPGAFEETETYGAGGTYEDPGAFEEPETFEEPEAFEEPETFEEPEAFKEPEAFEEPEAFKEPEAAENAASDPAAAGDDPDDPDPGIERTVAFRPQRPPQAERDEPPDEEHTEPLPRRLTDDDSTQIIPPASDAAQHRRES